MQISKPDLLKELENLEPCFGLEPGAATPQQKPPGTPHTCGARDYSQKQTTDVKKSTAPEPRTREKAASEIPAYDSEAPPDRDSAMTLPIKSMFNISQYIGTAYKNNSDAKIFLGSKNGPLDLYRLMAQASPNEFREYSQWVIAGQVTENVTLSQAITFQIFDKLSSEPEKIMKLAEIKKLFDEQARAAVALGLRINSLPAKPASPVQINLSAAAGIRQDVTLADSGKQEDCPDLSKKKDTINVSGEIL